MDKPAQKYLAKLDNAKRQREYKRFLCEMKRNGLIAYGTRDYEHGITLTEKGRARAKKANYRRLTIRTQNKWDGKWRMVFFDIPETKKHTRDQLSFKLRTMGFRQLQRSVWVHPYPCHDEVAAITEHLSTSDYVTYIETNYIDAAEKLAERFPFKLKPAK